MQRAIRIDQPEIIRLAAYLVVMSVTLAYLVFALWPTSDPAGKLLWTGELSLLGAKLTIAPEVRLSLVVMLSGAIGSYFQSATTFAFLVNRPGGIPQRYVETVWRSTLSAVVGAALATVSFSAIRIALLSQGSGVGEVNLFGAVSLAGTVGFFSNAAMEKLRSIIDMLSIRSAPVEAPEQSTPISTDPSRFSEDLKLEADLQALLNHDQRNRDVATQLIAVRRRLNKHEEAAQVYDVLLSNDPENVELIRDKAALYREMGDERRYIETVEQAERISAQRNFEQNVGKEITLRELEIRDLRFFGNFKWQFQPNVNVLLGKNGYGKSHLLRALVAMLQNEKEITREFLEKSGKEAMIRVDIQREGATESAIRSRLVFEKSFGKAPILAIPDMRYLEKSNPTIGAPSRALTDLRSQGAEHFMRDESFEGVILNFLYDLCFDYFERGRTFDLPIFQLMQKTVQELTSSTFQFQEIIRKDSARFEIRVLTDGNESNPLPLQKASQGTLSVLTMVGLTYRYLNSLYPQLSDKELPQQHAIVIIDEIDAHLHPTWQQKILQMFRDTFPNVQFIVTAHSPLVVGGCKEREVAVLQKGTDGFTVRVMEEHFIGATALSIYERIFQVEDKDLTYLQLNTLLGTKDQSEKRVAQLEGREKLSPEEQSELKDLRNQLYYLREVGQVRAERQRVEDFENQRQMLDMEAINLRGEVDKLKTQIEVRKQIDDGRKGGFLNEFLRENPSQSSLVDPFIKYLGKRGGFTEAASLLETLVELQPQNLGYLKSLAVQYQSMEDYKRAAVVLRKALTAFPNDEELRSVLSNLDKLQGG